MVAGAQAFRLEIPVHDHRLSNGLRVIVSPDHSAPLVTVAVYYGVGMRVEPPGRTGFAHLFEHLMFQGSGQMGKHEVAYLVEQNGGMLNGSTSLDFTNYFEVLPAPALELALWIEAERMRGPSITQAELDNQRDVVKSEIRLNVLNQPYGGFPWLPMSERAFRNWHNAHNGYGDMADLDAAALPDVERFFVDYYSPSNAVLVVVGDCEPARALELATRAFETIPPRPVPPPADLSEPPREAELRATYHDPRANRPALAISYHTPPRGSRAFDGLALLDHVLLQGDDSRLHQELVRRHAFSSSVDGGINFLGNAFNARTPLLWTSSLVHDPHVAADAILDAFDGVLEEVRVAPLDEATFARALVKARSAYYDTITGFFYPSLGRADLLASFALFDDDPRLINAVPARFDALTPELVHETAREVLAPRNRTVLELEPGLPKNGHRE
ncbi:MAG: insulinase family protein [Chloroflexi bacterium]|nr:insulinase family protein [Chloroflexota bacterium]